MNKFIGTSWYGNSIRYQSANCTDAHVQIAARLLWLLPHGSGINSDWTFTFCSGGRLYASNRYDAMDEYGHYCHIYPFTALLLAQGSKWELLDVEVTGRELLCCSLGLRDYLADTIQWRLISDEDNK